MAEFKKRMSELIQRSLIFITAKKVKTTQMLVNKGID